MSREHVCKIHRFAKIPNYTLQLDWLLCTYYSENPIVDCCENQIALTNIQFNDSIIQLRIRNSNYRICICIFLFFRICRYDDKVTVIMY